MTQRINRRDFLKKAAVTGACVNLAPLAPSLSARAGASAESTPQPEEPRPQVGKKSRVVDVHAPGVLLDGKKPHSDTVHAMISDGMLALTGESDLQGAWGRFVSPDDVVGIKVNGAAGRLMGTHREVLEAVIDGIRQAGVPARQIIVWDQVERFLHEFYLRRIGIDPAKTEDGVQYRGCTAELKKEHWMDGQPLPGYDTEPVKFAWGQVRLAELVQNEITAIINLPVLKDHSCSGVTLALKNISHAIIDQPWHCHGNCCDPYIADIVGIPSVQKKLRLHILDALFGLADGGPGVKSRAMMFPKERILLSRDPVAIDAIGRDWVVEGRREKKLVPLEEALNALPEITGRAPRHIATAAARGLGTDDPARMERIELAIAGPDQEEAGAPENGGDKKGEG